MVPVYICKSSLYSLKIWINNAVNPLKTTNLIYRKFLCTTVHTRITMKECMVEGRGGISLYCPLVMGLAVPTIYMFICTLWVVHTSEWWYNSTRVEWYLSGSFISRSSIYFVVSRKMTVALAIILKAEAHNENFIE